MLILHKFFLKYERWEGGQRVGIKLNPPEKTTLKKPSLIKVKIQYKQMKVGLSHL